MAQQYEYTQLFVNEGPDVMNILHKILKRIEQKDYQGELRHAFVQSLYLSTYAESRQSKGLSGGAARDDLRFSKRQKTVINYLNNGLTQREIAELMGIKPSTVKSHMVLIYGKLDVSNRLEAIVKIRELDLVNDE